MRKFIFIVGVQVFYYLIWCFIALSWEWYIDWSLRAFYILTESIVCLLCFGFLQWFWDWTPEWLKDKTHQQKKTTIKQYIWELHEELKLYWEAMELQRKIKEFKNK